MSDDTPKGFDTKPLFGLGWKEEERLNGLAAFWTSCNDKTQESVFVNADGSSCTKGDPAGYSAWRGDQPDNIPSADQFKARVDCTSINLVPTGLQCVEHSERPGYSFVLTVPGISKEQCIGWLKTLHTRASEQGGIINSCELRSFPAKDQRQLMVDQNEKPERVRNLLAGLFSIAEGNAKESIELVPSDTLAITRQFLIESKACAAGIGKINYLSQAYVGEWNDEACKEIEHPYVQICLLLLWRLSLSLSLSLSPSALHIPFY